MVVGLPQVPFQFGWSPVTSLLALIPFLLSPFVLAVVIYWDATKRELPRRIIWVGGAVVSILALPYGPSIVGVLYFLVNKNRADRARSTGYALLAVTVLQGILAIPFVIFVAQSPILVIWFVLPWAIFLLSWFISG